MIKKTTILSASLLLFSCANPINTITAERYFNKGHVLANSNNWHEARESYGRAIANSEWGNLPDNSKALYSFHFGRASGVICDWENSQKYLQKAYEIYSKIDTKVFYELIELAQMNQVRENYKVASGYYAKTIENIKLNNFHTKIPMAYADTLLKYSSVEYKLGNKNKATSLSTEAEEILKNNPGKNLPEGTPYGKFCNGQH